MSGRSDSDVLLVGGGLANCLIALRLHALRPEERALARGLRVELMTARTGDSFAALARRAPLKNEPEAILRLLNGKYPQGEPAPGELVKLIH